MFNSLLLKLCRGLYSLVDWNIVHEAQLKTFHRRGLYSLVDWNDAEGHGNGSSSQVEAYTASWIEIAVLQLALKERWSRGLYSLVDWNIFLILFARKIPVEAYTASWIEIPKSCSILSRSCVEAYTASWIEIIASNPSTGFLSSRGLYSLVDWNAEYTPQ